MTYPTYANLKTFLGTSSSAEDTLLGWIIDAAIAFVEVWTGHDFVAQASQTIYVNPVYPARLGPRVLLIRQYDVMAVTEIKNGDGVVVAAANYRLLPLDGPPYHKIELAADSGLCWTRGAAGTGVVAIKGTTGFSTGCPKDVFLAILMIGAAYYRARSSGGMGTVMTATRQGLVIEPGNLPPEILALLEPYRRWRG